MPHRHRHRHTYTYTRQPPTHEPLEPSWLKKRSHVWDCSVCSRVLITMMGLNSLTLFFPIMQTAFCPTPPFIWSY